MLAVIPLLLFFCKHIPKNIHTVETTPQMPSNGYLDEYVKAAWLLYYKDDVYVMLSLLAVLHVLTGSGAEPRV